MFQKGDKIEVTLKNLAYCNTKPGENHLITTGIASLKNEAYDDIKRVKGIFLGYDINSINVQPERSSNDEKKYYFKIKMTDIKSLFPYN